MPWELDSLLLNDTKTGGYLRRTIRDDWVLAGFRVLLLEPPRFLGSGPLGQEDCLLGLSINQLVDMRSEAAYCARAPAGQRLVLEVRQGLSCQRQQRASPERCTAHTPAEAPRPCLALVGGGVFLGGWIGRS